MRALGLGALCALLLCPSRVLAQPAPASPEQAGAADASAATTDAAGEAPSPEALAEARRRFDRGIELYTDGDFALALIEFNRAYQLVSNYRVLYNIGQVNLQLGRYADARRALERYMREGAGEIPENRALSVQRDLAMLEQRTAFLNVTVNVPGAEILLDEVLVGTAPLEEALLVDAGVHRVTARRPGYSPRSQQVTLAGADESTLALSLDLLPSASQTIVVRERTLVGTDSRTTWLIVGWSATGALAAGAVVAGIMGANKASALEELRASQTRREDLDKAQSSAKSFLLASDVLTAGAVVVGGLSLWATLSSPNKEQEKPAARPTRGTSSRDERDDDDGQVDVGFGYRQVRLRGTF